MREFKVEVDDDIIQIKDHHIQTGLGYAPELDLFSYLGRVTGDDISQYKETCEVFLDYPKIGGGDIF